MDLDADIDIMLADSGLDMTFGAFSGKCLEDVSDEEMLPGVSAALGEVRIITIRTSAFPGLEVGSLVTVDGTSYKLIDRKRVADGRLTLCALGVSA